MVNPNLFNASPAVAKKVNRLYQLLLKERSLFEQVAIQVTDSSLQRNILSLAQQNNQYATELGAYIKTGSSPVATTRPLQKKNTASLKQTNLPTASGVLAFCSSNEKKIVTAYQHILQEPDLYEGLEHMMRYQLNGIVCTGTQLKLLSAVNRRRTQKASRVADKSIQH